MEKLLGKYGKNAVFYDTDGITNNLINLFKYRDMAENNKIISDFLIGKNKDYIFIIDYLSKYIEYIEFVMWPLEITLQVTYKILCDRIMSDKELKSTSDEYKKLKELAVKMFLIRNKKGDYNESK